MSAEATKKWRTKTKENLVKAMGGKCVCCGYNKCNRALSFHHLDPSEKDFSFGNVRANPRSIEKIIAEVKKCVMVCNNCHAEIHDNIITLPKDAKSFDEEIYKEIIKKEIFNCAICDKEIKSYNKTCSLACAAK